MFFLVLAAAGVAATMPEPVKRLHVDDSIAESLGRVAKPTGSSTRIDLTVDAAGKPIRCEVKIPDVVAAFNSIACRTMMHQTAYVPARDANGEPIAAVLRFDIKSTQIYRSSIVRNKADGSANADARNSGKPAESTVDFAIPISVVPPGGPFTTDLILTTDASGNVVRCDLKQSSAQAVLDGLACSQMVHTSFEAARDGGGSAVRALRQVSVGFVASTPSN